MPSRSTCNSCKAEIVWVTMESGSPMPLDAEPVPHGTIVIIDGKGVTLKGDLFEGVYSGSRYRSHFSTCPEAQKWRSKKQSGKK